MIAWRAFRNMLLTAARDPVWAIRTLNVGPCPKRKLDARRKIIVGAAVLDYAEVNQPSLTRSGTFSMPAYNVASIAA